MKVDLKEVVEGLTMVGNSTFLYYDKDDNTVDYVFTDFLDEMDDESKETIPENIIHFPSQYEINEYKMMEDFIYVLPDGERKGILWDAINGRSAFMNFKNLVRRFNIQEDWYDFQNEAYTKIAKRWCEDNGLKYTL